MLCEDCKKDIMSCECFYYCKVCGSNGWSCECDD